MKYVLVVVSVILLTWSVILAVKSDFTNKVERRLNIVFWSGVVMSLISFFVILDEPKP